jgi:hypothetical protein
MIFYWSLIGNDPSSTNFFSSMLTRLIDTTTNIANEYLIGEDTTQTVFVKYFVSFSEISNFLYNLGYNILLFFACTGILLSLNKYRFNKKILPFFIPAIGLWVLIYPMTFLGFSQMILPHRFISFLELFLIFFASIAIYHLISLNSQVFWKYSMMILVSILIFFMITTPFINRNDPVYCDEREYRTDAFNSEIQGFVWSVKTVPDSDIFFDPLFTVSSIPTIEVANYNLDISHLKQYPQKISQYPYIDYIIIREYVEKNPEKMLLKGGSFGELLPQNSNNLFVYVKKSYNLIYDDRSIKIFNS